MLRQLLKVKDTALMTAVPTATALCDPPALQPSCCWLAFLVYSEAVMCQSRGTHEVVMWWRRTWAHVHQILSQLLGQSEEA